MRSSSLFIILALAGCAASSSTEDTSDGAGEQGTGSGAGGEAGGKKNSGGAGSDTGEGGAGEGGAGATGEGGAGATAGTGGAAAVEGLPCEVAALMAARCWSCHGVSKSAVQLVTVDDFKGLTKAGKSAGEVSVEKMQQGQMPPAPAAPVPAAEQSAFGAWVSAGMPASGCGAGGSGGAGQGGEGGAGAGGSGEDPYNTPVTCTSNATWTKGDAESPLMHPGGACRKCHALGGKAGFKTFDVGGTVYPSAHEPDECNGVSVSGAKVIIIDANNQEHPLDVNEVGNFYHIDLLGFGAFKPPYRARVEYNGKKREMIGAQMSGDCNACHTQDGTDKAPGRIMLP